METRLPICMCTVISHWGKIRIFHNGWPVFCHFHQKIKFSTILVLPNWHAKYYIEGEACLLLNQVMKGKNKGKKNKNQLSVLSWKSGIVLEKCFIYVVLNISFPFFEKTLMLAFSSPLVFAQQDHLPLKKNMEYVKWLVSIMPGWRSPVYLIIRRSSWRMVTLLPTRPN